LKPRPATTKTIPNRLVDLAGADRLEHLADLERAGRTVHHRQAVEQEAARERAQHEVFHRRFGRIGMVAAQRDQRVQAQRHQLEAEVDDEEVVRRQHHVDAEQREHAEREQLAPQHVSLARVRPCVDERDDHRDRGEHAEQVAHRVGNDHALRAVHRGAVVEREQMHHADDGDRDQRQPVGGCAARVGDPQVDHRDHAGHGQQHDVGVDGGPVHG
jgi:hypothetical protein